jgi:hypothetical protein
VTGGGSVCGTRQTHRPEFCNVRFWGAEMPAFAGQNGRYEDLTLFTAELLILAQRQPRGLRPLKC